MRFGHIDMDGCWHEFQIIVRTKKGGEIDDAVGCVCMCVCVSLVENWMTCYLQLMEEPIF